MKKLITLIAIASTFFVSCNDPKDPPDETKITKTDTTQAKELPKQ